MNDINIMIQIAHDRFRIIAPLLAPDLEYDLGRKFVLYETIAEENDISVRTLQRYVRAYKESSFAGLMPQSYPRRKLNGRPENWQHVLDEACHLKREIPQRSARNIIKILEEEGWVDKGILARSTLDRWFRKEGVTRSDLLEEEDDTPDMSTRFCKPSRMLLAEADIKYGPDLPIGKNGHMVKTYFSAFLDDHTRWPLASCFYSNQRKEMVEDTVIKALKAYGKVDCLLFDNGTQYTSKHLIEACARLGIMVRHCKVYHPYTKGCIEAFNRHISDFLREFAQEKDQSLEHLNNEWQVYQEAHYKVEPHSGIKEYYTQRGLVVPDDGISPKTEWMRDKRPLQFFSEEEIDEAFLYRHSRKVYADGTISFMAIRYFVSKAKDWRGKTITIIHKLDLSGEPPEKLECVNPDGNTLTASIQTIKDDIDFEEYERKTKEAQGKKKAREEEAKKNASNGSRFLRALEKKQKEMEEAEKRDPSFPALPVQAPDIEESPVNESEEAWEEKAPQRISYASYEPEDDDE